MILFDNGDIESERSSDDEMPPLEDCIDVDVAEPINEDVLVTRCALNMKPKVGGCRNLPFGGRATRDSRVRVLRKEYARSRHQRLFEENVGKTGKDVIYEL